MDVGMTACEACKVSTIDSEWQVENLVAHAFPSGSSLSEYLKSWLNFCHLPLDTNAIHDKFLCSRHFNADDYLPEQNGILKPEAIPHLYPPTDFLYGFSENIEEGSFELIDQNDWIDVSFLPEERGNEIVDVSESLAVLENLKETLCRLCGKTKNTLSPIYSSSSNEEDRNFNIIGLIEAYLHLKISENNNLPLNICLECSTILKQWHGMYTTCHAADSALQKIFWLNVHPDLTNESSNSECREEEKDELQEEVFASNVDDSIYEQIIYDSAVELSHDMFVEEGQSFLILDSSSMAHADALPSSFLILPGEGDGEGEPGPSTGGSQGTAEVLPPEKPLPGSETRPKPKYQCPYCLQSFQSSVWKKRHLLECGDVCSVCDVCGEVIPHRKYLSSHKRTHRTTLRCHKCEYRCNTSAFLVSHVLQVHNEQLSPSFHCEPCCRVYYSFAQYNSHLRMHRAGRIKQNFAYGSFFEEGRSPAYVCTVCGSGFEDKISLIEHLNTGKTLKCPTCQDEVSNERSLAVHFARKVFCPFCGKAFCTYQLMKAHERVHTKEKPYKCEECEASFRTANQREQHQTVHAPPMFECEFCGKTFRYKGGYRDHLNYHKGKLVPCPICERRYGGNASLLRHMRRYHKNRDSPGDDK